MLRTILSVLLVVSVLPSFASAKQNIDVYIIAGQSNADGRGEVSDLTDAQRSSLESNAIISYLNPGSERERTNPLTGDLDVGTDGFQDLVPGGFSVDLTSTRNLSQTFGPELSFAASISEATGSTNQIAIIKVTRGGTNLRNDWLPNSNVNTVEDEPEGFLYRALLEEIASSIEELEEDGSTANVEGFVWHQGESDDGGGPLSNYAQRFSDLAEGVRGEFGADIPFVLGELARGRGDGTGSDDFNNNLPTVVDGLDGLSFISSEGLTTPDNDTTHFDANGQIELGRRFAAAFTTTAVPEPSSGLLVLSLGLGMVVRRNRKR